MLLKQKNMTYDECHKIIDGIDNKLCNKCWEWYPCNNGYFYKNDKNKMDGFNPYCKVCTKKKSRDWQINNEERWKVVYTYHNNNPTPENLALRKFYSKNRRENYYRDYYSKNKEKFKEYNLTRDDKRHIIDDLEWEECKKYFNHRCAYCEVSLEDHYKIYKEDLHKEHIDCVGKKDLSNCIPSCKNCNSQKWMFTFDEWYNENNKNYSIERFSKIKQWLQTDYLPYIRNFDFETK